ncbi:MAG: MMPL family transporter [Pseudomonadota bacterium]
MAHIIISVCKRARSWVAGYLILLALSAVAIITFLGVDTDSSKMLDPDLAFQQRTQALNEDFPAIKNAMIVVVRADISDAADAAAIQIVRALVEDPDLSPHVTDVFSASTDAFFRRNGLLFQSEEELDETLSRLNKSASLLASLRGDPTLPTFFRSLSTAEELGKQADFDLAFLDDFYGDVRATIEARLAGNLVPLSWAQTTDSTEDDAVKTERGVQRIIYMQPVLDFTAVQPAKQAFLAVNRAIDSIDADLKAVTEIGITGDPVLRFEELRSVSTGIGVSLGLSLALVAGLLFIAFRTIKHVVLTLLALVAALILTTGFAALYFGDLNLVSVAFVVLLVGLGLDFTIHVLAHVVDEPQSCAPEAMAAMGQTIGGALILSALTTAFAFLSFVPTKFVGMAQLGVLGAVGVMVAFIVSVTLVPALITCIPWFRARALKQGVRKDGSLTSSVLTKSRTPLALGLLALGTLAIFVLSDVRFDADPVGLRDPDSPSMLTLEALKADPDTVPYRLSLVRSDAASAIETARDLEALRLVKSARTADDFVPKEQDVKFEIIDLAFPTMETIVGGEGLEQTALPPDQTPLTALRDRLAALGDDRPAARDLAVTLTRLNEADAALRAEVERDIFRFFPDLIATVNAQLEVDTVTLDGVPDALKARFISEDGRWRIDIAPSEDVDDPRALERFVAQVEAFDGEAAGAPLQIVNAGKTVSAAMVQALTIAAIGILAISFAVLQNVTAVFAIGLPLALAALLTAGASAFFAIPFNYANVIVLPLLIGLGVDSGIHMASRRKMLGSSDTLYKTSTPRAVLFSGLTTIAAFATLSVSDHRGTASMGQMLAISITATLLATVILTPILMDAFSKSQNRASRHEK